jgi:hypothetical protein
MATTGTLGAIPPGRVGTRPLRVGGDPIGGLRP